MQLDGSVNPITQLSQKLRNPYMNIYYWVKGEINDVYSLQQAIEYRLKPAQAGIHKIKSKIESMIAKRDKLQQGKISIKTVLKSSREKDNYM